MAEKPKLSETQRSVIMILAGTRSGSGYLGLKTRCGANSVTLANLRKVGLITTEKRDWLTVYKLTDAGRAYAIAQGWLAAPAAEPQPATLIQVGDIVETESGIIGTVKEVGDCDEYFNVWIIVEGGGLRKVTDFEITDVWVGNDDNEDAQPERQYDTRVSWAENMRQQKQALQVSKEQSELETLRAENAKLRAALRNIANNAPISKPPYQFDADYTPALAAVQAHGFWYAGILATEALNS